MAQSSAIVTKKALKSAVKVTDEEAIVTKKALKSAMKDVTSAVKVMEQSIKQDMKKAMKKAFQESAFWIMQDTHVATKKHIKAMKKSMNGAMTKAIMQHKDDLRRLEPAGVRAIEVCEEEPQAGPEDTGEWTSKTQWSTAVIDGTSMTRAHGLQWSSGTALASQPAHERAGLVRAALARHRAAVAARRMM